MFILIEGDNGTGKDTLALGLGNQFDNITYHEEIQNGMTFARTFEGVKKVLRFVDCNATGSKMVQHNKSMNVDSLMIRYWPSTVAAAYADKRLTENQCDKLAEMCRRSFETPDIILYLECNHDERVRRIILRNSPNFDDKTTERAARYAYYSQKILQGFGDRVYHIGTSGKTAKEVLAEAQATILTRRGKCVA